MIIYDKEGVVLLDIEVDDTSVRYKAIKGENSLTLKFSLPEHVEVPLGAYCEFKGETYTLMMPEDLTMNHRRSFEYSLVMHSEDAKAKRFMFINPVDGRLKFSLTAKPIEHLQMFCDNMNKREGGNAWRIGECVDHVEIVLSYNHTYCYDALVQLANELEVDYWFDGKTVNLGKLEVNKDEPLPLSYGGDGLGLKSNIKRTNYADALPMEILYVQGGSANIDPSKYRVPDGSAIGSSVLLLPSSKRIGYDGVHFEGEDGFDVIKARYYVTDSDGYSVRRADKEIQNYAEDSLDCSEIKPTREETVVSVIESDKEKHFYDLVFKSDVDYKKYGIEGEIATIVFQSGMLAGKEFDLATDTNGNLICANAAGGHWRVEIVPQDIDGITMPDEASGYLPVKGDTFKVFGVQLPNEYVSEAEMEMLRYAVKHLYANEDAQYTISGELDEIYAKRNWDAIRNKIVLGGYVSFSDRSFQEEPLLIRITGIKEYVNKPYSPMLEISNAAVAGSLIGSITRLENDEVRNEQMYRDAVRYSKRRFSSALDTIAMLEGAFKEYSSGISPVTVQTMAMLIGDESLQFKFTSLVGTAAIKPAISYDAASKRLLVSRSYRIWHMTLGIDSVTSPSGRSNDDYLKWAMPTWNSGVLDDESKGYYLYARVPKDGTDGNYLLSENTIAMESEEGYYHLLVGVLNKEYEGTRDFVPLYGFTEVLPGQITTDVIKSADGETYFNLSQGEIGGTIHLKAGSKGLENIIDEVTIGGQNLLRNSGFTGDYLSERLADEIVLDATSQMENNPLAYWNESENVSVVADNQSASGFAVSMTEGSSLRQTLHTPTIGSENYVFTLKAKGDAELSLRAGGGIYTFSVASVSSYEKYKVSFVASVGSADFALTSSGSASVCELQLERGTVSTSWGNSPFDNSSDRSYYQALKYLSDAIKGTTTIDGGLVLTNTLKLGNGSNDSAFVEMAGANGIHIDEDSPAFWAGGTMDQAIELISRVRDGEGDLSGLVDFVVTHGGMAVLRNLKLFADSGSIGGLKVTSRGLAVDTNSDGTIEFTSLGLVTEQKDGSRVELGTCGSQAAVIVGKGGGWVCYKEEDNYKIAAQISTANGGHAIHSLGGVFAGLRPNIRKITSNATLDLLDHTVILSNTTGMALTLPVSPQTGQTYKLIHTTDRQVQLICGQNDMIIDASTVNTEVTTFAERTTLTLTYHEGIWYAEFK